MPGLTVVYNAEPWQCRHEGTCTPVYVVCRRMATDISRRYEACSSVQMQQDTATLHCRLSLLVCCRCKPMAALSCACRVGVLEAEGGQLIS